LHCKKEKNGFPSDLICYLSHSFPFPSLFLSISPFFSFSLSIAFSLPPSLSLFLSYISFSFLFFPFFCLLIFIFFSFLSRSLSFNPTGPPGSGKTLAFWVYLLHRVSVGDGVVGVFVRCDGDRARCVTVRKVGQALTFSVYPSVSIGLLGAICGYVPFVERMFSVDVVGSKCVAVLDGLSETNIRLLSTVTVFFANLAEKKGNMFARVSSLRFKLDYRHQVRELWQFFKGWDFEDYVDACRKSPALMDWMENLEDLAPLAGPSSPPCKRAKQDDVDVRDVCQQKFFYAGRSARWFFNLSRALVASTVEHFIDALKPGSNAEQVATHHIMFVEGNERHVVSAYALRKIRDTAHAAGLFDLLVAAVSAVAGSGNPLVAPLRGWMFEMAIHEALRKSSYITIFRKSGGSLRLPAAGVPVVKFAKVNEIATTTPPHSDGKADPTWDVWLSPTQYNQGGFDCAYVSISKQVMHVTFVQTTVAKRHSVNWRYMLQLLAHLCGFREDTARVEFLAASGDAGNSNEGDDDRGLPAVMEAVSLNDQTAPLTLAIKSEVPPTIFGQTVAHVKVTLILLTHSPGDAEYFVAGFRMLCIVTLKWWWGLYEELSNVVLLAYVFVFVAFFPFIHTRFFIHPPFAAEGLKHFSAAASAFLSHLFLSQSLSIVPLSQSLSVAHLSLFLALFLSPSLSLSLSLLVLPCN